MIEPSLQQTKLSSKIRLFERFVYIIIGKSILCHSWKSSHPFSSNILVKRVVNTLECSCLVVNLNISYKHTSSLIYKRLWVITKGFTKIIFSIPWHTSGFMDTATNISTCHIPHMSYYKGYHFENIYLYPSFSEHCSANIASSRAL